MPGILLLAAEAGITSFVRVPKPRREIVLKCLEMGAKGLLFPNTKTGEQAHTLVNCLKSALLGSRGVACVIEHTGFLKPGDVIEYMRMTNEETILMVQIDSPLGFKI